MKQHFEKVQNLYSIAHVIKLTMHKEEQSGDDHSSLIHIVLGAREFSPKKFETKLFRNLSLTIKWFLCYCLKLKNF